MAFLQGFTMVEILMFSTIFCAYIFDIGGSRSLSNRRKSTTQYDDK